MIAAFSAVSPKIVLFNLDSLFENLNARLPQGRKLEKGHGTPQIPIICDAAERYPIYQDARRNSGRSPIFGDVKIVVGSLYTKAGEDKDDDTRYEVVDLRFSKTLALDGETIPRSRIVIRRGAGEYFESPEERADYLPGLAFWRKADLSGLLPSEWFGAWSK